MWNAALRSRIDKAAPQYLPYGIVRKMVTHCTDRSRRAKRHVNRFFLILVRSAFCGILVVLGAAPTYCQVQDDEIVASLAGGRVIVDVAKEVIVFAAVDEPVERNSIPPRVMELDATHIGVLLGASEWRVPADPKPIRLDRNFQRIGRPDPRYESIPGEVEPDLETIGTAFLETLHSLVSQLHHKLDFKPDEDLLQVVIIGYAPNSYGPEVWVAEYHIEQNLVPARGEYWQTRILRPRFTQLYPPEKHEPHTLVESRYPPDAKGPTLLELIKSNDPRVSQAVTTQPRFEKVLENIRGGQTQKSTAAEATDFMKAVLPSISSGGSYVLGTMDERQGFGWVIPPNEPVEKVEQDKDRAPGAPTLRKPPKP